MAELTNQRVTSLYDLMDSAYDAPIIKEHSKSLGHVPVIDITPRGNKKLKEDLKAEGQLWLYGNSIIKRKSKNLLIILIYRLSRLTFVAKKTIALGTGKRKT